MVEYPLIGYDDLKKIIILRGNSMFGKFNIDSYNEKIIDALCLYFSKDARFNDLQANFSLNKGIFLFGEIGCGKTAIMSLFQDNSFKSFSLVSCSKISNDFTQNGTAVIDKYSSLIQSSRPDLTYGQKFLGVCFDDFGTEENKKHFGNSSNVMADILLARYSNNFRMPGQTHLTTNLTEYEIENIYGNRVRSRMREMFNVIEFSSDSPDRRK